MMALTMTRIVAFAVLVSFVGVSVAQAQERRVAPRMSVSFLPPATPGVMAPTAKLTKSSIERAVASAMRNANIPAVRRRNVLKKAWFWIVVGGAAVALV